MNPPEPFSLYQFPNVPSSHKLMIVGEAPGEEEDKAKIPFIGSAGKLLNELLSISGFTRGVEYSKGQPPHYFSEFHVTNVFSRRPPGNDLKQWTANKNELRKMGYNEQGRLPPLNKRYLLPEYEPELERLETEISEIKPDLILALGGTALWALTGDGRITMNRGNFFQCKYGCTAIASFHPAMVLRQWDMRPLLWSDLSKTRRLLNGSLPEPLARQFWINPTLEELAHVYNLFAARPVTDILGVDIETDPRCDQITTVSFGFADLAVCIPFYDKYALPDRSSYWPTADEEAQAWQWVKRFGDLPHPKAGQNFLYDMQYFLEPLDIRLRNVQHDTAIMQHSLQPELPKALGVLASVYLNEPSWKFMRESTKDDNKADD